MEEGKELRWKGRLQVDENIRPEHDISRAAVLRGLDVPLHRSWGVTAGS